MEEIDEEGEEDAPGQAPGQTLQRHAQVTGDAQQAPHLAPRHGLLVLEAAFRVPLLQGSCTASEGHRAEVKWLGCPRSNPGCMLEDGL